jgi:transcriptional regulator with XRE-family HTH domain
MPVYRSHLLSYGQLNLGQRLREERQKRGLTLEEIARKCRISTGRFSQLETGQHVIDVRQACAIAEALAVPLDSLVPADISVPYQITRDGDLRSRPPRQAPLVRVSDGERVAHHHFFWPLAELFIGRHIEPVLARIVPLSDEQLQFCCHHYEEFAFVLKGSIEFLIKTPHGVTHEELGRGDSIQFRSELPHCMRSLEADPAETLHVMSSLSVQSQTGRDWFSPHAAAYLQDEGADVSSLVGLQLRVLREAHGWTLKEAADLAGVAERQLNHVERGSRAAPLDVLINLARAYGRPLRQFLRNPGDNGLCYVIQRARDIPLLPTRNRTIRGERAEASRANVFHRLAGGFPVRYMYPCLVKVLNVEADGVAPHEHHGQEFIYVLEGELELTTYAEDKEVKETIRAGDSCFLDSTVPHMISSETRNPYSETSAELLDVFWCPMGESYLFET